jgi:hypothetical protein
VKSKIERALLVSLSSKWNERKPLVNEEHVGNAMFSLGHIEARKVKRLQYASAASEAR